jgi:hypothetical protein
MYVYYKALFRVGVDQRIVNKQGKTADAYLEDNPQLIALYEGYGEGIWAAIETSNVQETERLVKGKSLIKYVIVPLYKIILFSNNKQLT